MRRSAGAKATESSEPKATTVRLKPGLQKRLKELGKMTQKPVNRLVNEAVEDLIQKRSQKLQAELQDMLERVKALRKKDPDFEAAIELFVVAEATTPAQNDPLEGTVKTPGPVQSRIQGLLGG